jgi:Mitochondrial large subunit ribosomal protein (Img2).
MVSGVMTCCLQLLQDELKSYLEKRSGKYIHMQVHEVCQHVNIRGDYVRIVEEWLQDKGF